MSLLYHLCLFILHILLILHLFIARFYVCDYPGVEDDDWLLEADEDSPVLNNAAVAHAETR